MSGTLAGRERLVLASASAARADMLRRAGLDPEIDPADVDEAALKSELQSRGGDPEQAADALAEAKAGAVSLRRRDRLVLGADQMLDCDGAWLDKPGDSAGAKRQLRTLSGKRHRLISSAVVARNGATLWRGRSIATLAMRPLSDTFIDSYVATAGNGILGSVGAYHIEGLGAQLFDAVEGDLFTVMGLPLLPLLGYLRQEGLLPS